MASFFDEEDRWSSNTSLGSSEPLCHENENGTDNENGVAKPIAEGITSGRIEHVLSGAVVPAQYAQLFHAQHPVGGVVSVDALEDVMDRAGVDSQSRYRICSLVETAHCPLDLQLWSICMTLVALAQMGRSDLSLSSVEHSKHHLPQVRMEESGPMETANGNQEWHDDLSYDPTAKDTIRVTLVPEREGVFMFRHVMYGVEGTYDGAPPNTGVSFKVSRRYSNFVWLQECLLKRYPFRQLPVLPPKRLTVNGKYFSSDHSFLDRRRRGLSRFINQLAKHPVLNKDKLVHVFLTADESQFQQWSKQLGAHIDEEFTGRIISPEFTASWDSARELDRWIQLVNSSTAALGCLSRLCVLADRMAKRQESMAADYERMSRSLTELQVHLPKVYQGDSRDSRDSRDSPVYNPSAASSAGSPLDTPIICGGVRALAKYASNASALTQDESQANDVGLLEELKQLRGFILSMGEVFTRYEKFGGDRIPELERRIELNKQKLSKPELKPTDTSRLNDAIARDTALIQHQRNRGWLIKECITEEIALFQRTQYQVSRVLRDFSADSVKYAELLNDNWASLNNEVQDLP